MKSINWTFTFLLFCVATFMFCNFASRGTFTEFSRIYSPDSSKFLLKYDYVQGAWDGGRSWAITILNATDSVKPENIKYSYYSYDFDNLYWKGSDTVVIEENFTEFLSQGKSALRDTVLNGVTMIFVQRDPIDTSFVRMIFYRETSPNGEQDLIVYKYVKPVNGNYFLNVSVINQGDSIPKFGNFYISRYGFDCFTNVQWNSTSILDIKVFEGCYHAFTDYLVKNRPDIKYKVEINNDQGNIRDYMQ